MDYSEQLFETIEVISKSVLNGISYDKTVACTIVDASKRENGEYIVSDGSIDFVAYSSVKTYRNGNTVYVMIPEGNYNNDKIIVSKKTSDEQIQPFIYEQPFENLLSVSDNLYTGNLTEGLTANMPEKYNGTNIVLCDIDYLKNGQKGYSTFTRFGVRAEFKAWLQEMNCISGNYGLKITLKFAPDISASQKTLPVNIRELYLDTSDMIGNPYSFNSFYSQEKVFDISSLGTLIGLKVEFFQEEGSFKDKDGNNISYIDDSFKDYFSNDEQIEENFLLKSNIFVQNIFLCVGYDVDDYDDDCVFLYTFDRSTFNQQTKDTRTVGLKWIHVDKDDRYEITSNMDLDYEIRWYRYDITKGKADNYSGVGWNSIETKTFKDYEITFTPDAGDKTEEKIKAIILKGKTPQYQEILLSKDEFLINYKDYYYKDNDNNYILYDSNESIGNNPSITCYYLEPDNREIFRSNILTFTNESPVPNTATIDAIRALSLICKDVENINGQNVLYNSYGNYLLYDETNMLIDRGQSSIERLLECYFDLASTEIDDTTTLQEAEELVWEFPILNTMILTYYVSDSSDYSYITYEDDDSIAYGYAKIIYKGDQVKTLYESRKFNTLFFNYYIKNYYSSTYDNNTIKCTILKDGFSYSAFKELTFGVQGTSGTHYTLVLDFDENKSAFTLYNKNDERQSEVLGVTARLYDSKNIEQDLNSFQINWSWYKKASKEEDSIMIVQTTTLGGHNEIKTTENTEINDLYILQATIPQSSKNNSWGDYPLTAYLSIPLRYNDDYMYITGATTIKYLSNAEPLYYHDKYLMHKRVNTSIEEYTWQRYPSTNMTDEIYQPVIEQVKKEQGYRIYPISMYVDGLNPIGVQCLVDGKVCWTNPILIYQSHYPSSIVNDWDGKKLTLDEDKSVILSTMIGAGKKDSNNKFTGVLLGDWKENSDGSMPKIGLYGFQNGAQSFSFTEDGKATIGKAGAGQIIIDSSSTNNNSKAVIQSAGYLNGSGMKIDLYGNTIDAKLADKTIFKLSASDPYLKISNTQDKILMNVGNNSYYLRSANYTSTTYTNTPSDDVNGMYIDLNNGNIYAKNGTFSHNINIRYNNQNRTLGSILQSLDSQVDLIQEQVTRTNSLVSSLNTQISRIDRVTSIASQNQNYLSSYFRFTNQGVAMSWVKGSIELYINSGGRAEFQGCQLYVSGSLVSSDKRAKEDIRYDLSDFKDYYFNLKPVIYKYKQFNNTNHIGFIAQEVLDNSQKSNLNNLHNFIPALEGSDNKEFEKPLYLDYNNFIGLNTYMIQEAYKEINNLKNEIKEIKEKL